MVRCSQYVAETWRKDWKKCCPFDLSSYSPESTFQAERVFASLILEDNDALINTPENTQAPNCKRPKLSEIQREKLPSQQPIQNSLERKSCHPCSGCEIWDDALIFVRSISPPKLLNSENMLAFAGEVIGNDATSIINDTPLESASGKVTYADCQIEKVIYGDMVAAENDKPEDVVVVDHSLKDIVTDGSSKSSSRKLKDDVQYQNENSVCEDIIDAGNETHRGFDDDGANTNSDEERNLAGEKPQKFRLLSDIYKQLQGPCDAVSAGYGDRDFSSESEEDDSDEFMLETFVRKKKGVRVYSKTGVASKKRQRSCKERERSFVQAKRMKCVPADSYRNDSELGSKRNLRKTRTDEVDLQDSLLSCGNKRRRETIQDDYGRDVSKFLDRSQRHFTEGNRSRSTHGVNSVQLVQPTIDTLYSIETASGCFQKSIITTTKIVKRPETPTSLPFPTNINMVAFICERHQLLYQFPQISIWLHSFVLQV
uniref:Uncharacterized protein n=1 Tax=Lactuca sativa TaxID=4236 RepID=A0A9R1VXH0_LACSA|nr:hypothetical protein LSAT_V11C400197670 [Lactuca sativa]